MSGIRIRASRSSLDDPMRLSAASRTRHIEGSLLLRALKTSNGRKGRGQEFRREAFAGTGSGAANACILGMPGNCVQACKNNRKSNIVAQDPGTGCPRKVIAARNVLRSSSMAWRRITAEAYCFESLDTPEFQAADHSVVLHLSSPALIEVKADGICEARSRVPGDVSIFRDASVRQVRSRESHEIVVVTLSKEVLDHSDFESSYVFELLPRGHLRDGKLRHLCRALKAEAESNYLAGPFYGEWLVLAIGAHLSGQTSSCDLSSGQRGGIAPRALRRVIDYIESNLDSPLRMAALAEIAGLSQYRFAHNFKSAIGLPPHQYVIRARIERAKRILRETDLSILDIACAVGCQSVSRFNSLFKRELGTTPSGYRASFR
jgi:AraC family transcriptional regulator